MIPRMAAAADHGVRTSPSAAPPAASTAVRGTTTAGGAVCVRSPVITAATAAAWRNTPGTVSESGADAGSRRRPQESSNGDPLLGGARNRPVETLRSSSGNVPPIRTILPAKARVRAGGDVRTQRSTSIRA